MHRLPSRRVAAIIALGVVLLIVAVGQAQEPAPSSEAVVVERPKPSLDVAFVVAPRTGVAPKIDGAVAERVWKRVLHLGPFIDINGRERARLDTRVSVTYDAENLYIAFQCREDEPENIRAQAKQRDSQEIFRDDVVEVYLDTKRDGKSYYHIIVNPAGTVADEIGRLGPESWDCAGLQVGCTLSSMGWNAELAIPFRSIGGAPGPATLWRVNFCRVRAKDGRASSYAGTRGTFHDPARFAEMAFSGAPLLVDIWDLGDAFGELRGGGSVRLGLRCTEARKVIPAVRVVRGFDSWIYTLPGESHVVQIGALREVRREIPYHVPRPDGAKIQIGVRDVTTGEVVFQSPLIPLQDTWLLPRVTELRARLSTFAAAAEAADTAHKEVMLQTIAKQRAALDEVEASVASKQWGSVKRWTELSRKLQGVADELASLQLLACFIKGRTVADVEAGRLPAYIVSRREPMASATYLTIPEYEDVKDGVYCEACPGEYEPVSFLVTANKDVKNLTVTASDLVGEAGAIPAANVDVRVVKCWIQAGRGIRKDLEHKVFVPELLVKDDRTNIAGLRPQVRLSGDPVTDVPAGRSKQFWVTIYIPEGTPHGLYIGKLTLRADGLAPREVKLACKVFGLKLSQPKQRYLIYYRQTLSGSGRDAIGEQYYRLDLADIRRHGFDQAMVYDAPEDLGRALSIRTELGLRGPVPVTVHAIEQSQLTVFVRDVRRVFSGGQYPEVWFYILDEPRTAREIEQARVMADAVHAGGGKTVTALDREVLEFLGDKLDVINYNIGTPAFRDYVLALVKGEAQPDPRPEFYYWQCMQEDPLINRLFCGFYLVKSKLDGVFPYVYQHAYSDDPFDDASGEGELRHSMVTYPSAAGPIATVQWEAAREGRDDVRYLATLRELIAQGRRYAADPEVGKQVQAAEKLQETILKTIQSDYTITLQYTKPQWYQQMHRQLLRQAWWLKQAIDRAAAALQPAGEGATPGGEVPLGEGLPRPTPAPAP